MAQHIQTASGRQAAAAKPESLFSNRNFRLLAIGQLISALGDQFYLVAIPWLALQMTGSALTAGTVLAVASVPRALFMLLGGAVTDRFSARKVLLAANGLQAVFIGLLSLVVLSGRVELWLVYLVALATGLPTRSAIQRLTPSCRRSSNRSSSKAAIRWCRAPIWPVW